MNSITFIELKEKFNYKLKEVKHPSALIQNEITEIEKLLEKTKNTYPIQGGIMSFAHTKKVSPHRVFDINLMGYEKEVFVEAFKSYGIYGSYEYENSHVFEEYRQPLLQIISLAREYVEYYNWLKSLKNKPTDNKAKVTLSHKEKMLALHYLGLDNSQFDNSKTAKVLSKVLDLNEENTRKYLSYLHGGKNEVRTDKNLKSVAKLFASAGLEEIAETILDKK